MWLWGWSKIQDGRYRLMKNKFQIFLYTANIKQMSDKCSWEPLVLLENICHQYIDFTTNGKITDVDVNIYKTYRPGTEVCGQLQCIIDWWEIQFKTGLRRGRDHITTKVVSSNPVHGEVYSIQHYVIKFVSNLRQVGGFLRIPGFPPPIKLTATI